MAAGIACVWLWTGLAVLHPHFLAVGGPYLDRLGLPRSLATLTCAFEVGLGLWVLLRPPDLWTTRLQLAAVGFFSLVLAALEPALLVHPFGVLTKNLPLVALMLVRWRVYRDGWTAATWELLRIGVASIWITEGLLPKIAFQQEFERQVVVRSGLVPWDPGAFLVFMGLLQAASGLAVLRLQGRGLRGVLACQAAGLLALPLLVAAQDPLLWVHPFAPLAKNLPILVGTGVLWCRPWRPSA